MNNTNKFFLIAFSADHPDGYVADIFESVEDANASILADDPVVYKIVSEKQFKTWKVSGIKTGEKHMKDGDILPLLAEKAKNNGNGQAWSTPQEMETPSGSYPHGYVDETSEGFRIWHDQDAIWFWVVN